VFFKLTTVEGKLITVFFELTTVFCAMSVDKEQLSTDFYLMLMYNGQIPCLKPKKRILTAYFTAKILNIVG